MSGKSALPANHFPDRFALDPSWLGSESAGFAFVMRFEPQDPTTWFEGTRACTGGAFHERNATIQKTREINGNHFVETAAGFQPHGIRLIEYFLQRDRAPPPGSDQAQAKG
jgi:hypothetical protein